VTDARNARWALRTSQVALALALLAAGRAATRSDGDVPLAPLSVERDTGATLATRVAGADPTAIARLLAGDPFSPRRAPPEVPYRVAASPAAAREPAPVAQAVRLLGTVVSGPGRSFAMCQVANEPARVVYPGERIGALTLDSVSQGSAVFFDDAGTRVVLRVPRTGG
jgi:hypothetical protein